MPGSPEALGPAILSTVMLFAAINCRSAAACAGSSPSSFASTKCGLAKRMVKSSVSRVPPIKRLARLTISVPSLSRTFHSVRCAGLGSGVSRSGYPVSYTHLTLPTKRIV